MDTAIVLGTSRAVLDVLDDADTIGPTDARVLITGESGVGKEVLARRIHERSPRRRQPLITINCAGVRFTDAHRDRRGLLDVAHRGTMLLDEVGEMSLRMQTMLLRFLEIGEIQRIGAEWQHARVDVRIIAATNRDLFEQTRQKDFREDLYYRLNVVHMVVLPLRARREDIRLLFAHFLRTVAEQYRLPVCRLSEDGVAQLRAYHWPGNVRELKNVAERVAVRCPGQLLTSVTLPADRRSQRNAQPSEPPATALGQMIADGLYDRMAGAGESFWTTVREPFIGRDITRDTVRAIIRRGLVATRGNYRMMAALFNCPTSDYKRFLKALDTHECHMRFQDFRTADRQFPHARQYPTSDATRPPIPTANG